jgi:outer membrane protein assembly factor BamB
MKRLLLGKLGAFAILSLSLFACKKDMSSSPTESSMEAASTAFRSNTNNPEGIIFYALAGNTLDKYSTSNPESVISSAMITGLQSGERVLGIDFRPKNEQLYALGSNSRVYVVNPSTGVATFAFSFMTTTGMAVTLSGTSFGVDFNPAADRLRIISNTGQNLRVVPDGIMGVVAGTTFVDGNINPSGASVNGAAYDNNDNDPATATELYAFDVNTDLLYEVDPPNAGTLIEPVPVKLKLVGDGGFDIAPRNANVTADIGLALYEVNKKSTLFKIDVETGETRILAKYKKDIMYTSLAISPAL